MPAEELLKTIKQIVKDTVEADKPATVMYGKVESVSPLKVRVDQKMLIPESQLILACNVTQFQTQCNSGSEQIVWTVHNELKQDEGVIILREIGRAHV